MKRSTSPIHVSYPDLIWTEHIIQIKSYYVKDCPVSVGDKDNNWLPLSLFISPLYLDSIVVPIWSKHEQTSDLWGGQFQKMSKNSIKLEPSEPGLFENFDPPKFTTKTPVTTINEQLEMGDEIGKFLQSELQPTLKDIERQLTIRQAVSERTQALMAKVLQAMIGVQASQIDFWATNILDEQNSKARRYEIQCPSLLRITLVPVPDEILDSKCSPIDKILQIEHALALFNLKIGERILAHLCEQLQEQLAIDVLCQMIHNLREAKRAHFAKALNENGANANYFNLAANSINSHQDSQAGSYMLGEQIIARSDTANKDVIGIINKPFGILQRSQAGVKTKRYHQLTPQAIRKQIMRPMLHQKENLVLEQNQETQITIVNNDMPPPNSGPRGQSQPEQGSTGPCTPRNAARLQAMIFPPASNAEQEIPEISNMMTKETIKDHMHKWMLKGFDLIPVGKDDEGQYGPGFDPGVPYATDWRKAKQLGQTPTIDDVRAFWRENNFDLRVACVRREYVLKDDSETLQPAKIIRQEFRNQLGRYRNRSLSSCNKKQRYNSSERRSESRDRS
ncbi:MAG: hypothetical protein EZS28_023774 [Streblomastix strix]|uniref:Uncharacterized protein n=1 Tax=Streblomastix strix TaxID=222440 RepID=A0A5J4VDR7_9EUKA|nr:MAG: hypothetical protein EZS28_023774 [Streblomastix strix]